MNLLLRRPRLRTPRRVRLALAVVLLFAGVAATCAPSIHDRNAVHLLKANSEVNPVMERYIDRGIDEAEREANLFAAALLMPQEFLDADLAGLKFFDLLDDGILLDLGT